MNPMYLTQSELIENLGPRLYRYFSTTFEEHKASDLTQETLMRLCQKINEGSIHQAKGGTVMFAYGIAKNVKKEAIKKTKAMSMIERKEAENIPYYDDTLDRIHDNIRLKQLRRAMAKLKDNEKEVLSLIVDDQLKLEEIAKLLKMPLGTVKSHAHRAKENLKQMLLSQIGPQYG